MSRDGGPAFPSTDQAVAHMVAAAAIEGIEDSAERDRRYIAARSQLQQGMTLRDYFAGQALQGYLASFPGHCEPPEVASTIAEDCYKLADAMLAVRSKT